jgi:hypothetical protein
VAAIEGYQILTSATYQDYVIFLAQPGEEVPVPGAVWLLGSGLFGLVALRKRVKS